MNYTITLYIAFTPNITVTPYIGTPYIDRYTLRNIASIISKAIKISIIKTTKCCINLNFIILYLDVSIRTHNDKR